MATKPRHVASQTPVVSPPPPLAVPAVPLAPLHGVFTPCPQGCGALLLARVWQDTEKPGRWQEQCPPVSAVLGEEHVCFFPEKETN